MKPPTIDRLARMSAAELEAHFEMHTVALDQGTYAIRVGDQLVVAESIALLRVNFVGALTEAARRAVRASTLTDRLVTAIEAHGGYTPTAADNGGRTLREVVEETIQEWRGQASGGLAE